MEIHDIDTFLDYFERIRERTRRVVRLIPPDKLEWRQRDGAFSLGEIVRHIAATERWMFAENVSGRPSAYHGCGTELADGFDAVLDYFETMHGEAMGLFRTVTTDRLREKCLTPGGIEITVWKWLRSMIEHEVHHRGQIYLLLGQLGVETPPLYGLTSEQVRDRSVAPQR